MGSPEQNVGSVTKAGAITVVYGNNERLGSAGSQTWHENSVGVPGASATLDKFGLALATGDFDGDGFDDLAVGIPGDDFAFTTDAGGVVVLYGLPLGLQAVLGRPSQRWNQFSLSGSGSDESGDRFGAALAAGNFNGDVNPTTGLPIDDLAIGVPGEDDSAGNVRVLYGSQNGLSASGADIWSQDTPGITGDYEGDDRFGAALAAGNFDGDRNPGNTRGLDDLAVGVPGEGFGTLLSFRCRCSQRHSWVGCGLTTEQNQVWTQDSDGIGARRRRIEASCRALLKTSHRSTFICVIAHRYGFISPGVACRSCCRSARHIRRSRKSSSC